jgi:uncharacterized protein (DUF2141 family)
MTKNVLHSTIGIILLVTQVITAQTPQSMHLSVEGLRNTEGQLIVFLFNDADSFPTKRDKAFRMKTVPSTSARINVSFDNVPPGTYGAAVYHDENSNGKMDRHWYGPPKEGYGASNDATGTFGPPSFSDAQFKFQRSQDTIKVIIHY